MRLIGIDGGHTVYELGPVSDVFLFFNCLDFFAKKAHPEKDWGVLTDRLYRRYLRMADLELAGELMELAREVFASLDTSSIEWDSSMLQEHKKTWLDASQSNLGEVFVKYFDLFVKAKESAISFFDEFGIYQVVRIIPSDMPLSTIERSRPLGEYEVLANDKLPFWLR